MRRGTTKPITLESLTPKEIEFYLCKSKEGVRTGLVSMLCNMVLSKISAYESAKNSPALSCINHPMPFW